MCKLVYSYHKLLDYLAKNTTEEKYDDNVGKMIKSEKGIGSVEGQYYIAVLKAVIGDTSIPGYPLEEKGKEGGEGKESKEGNEGKTTQQN